MHPLLLGRRRLILYGVACWDVGIAVGLLLHLIDQRSYVDAFGFAVPLAFLFGFVCLSAWWVCRSAPLATMPHTQLATRLLGATAQAAVVGGVLALAWEAFLVHAFGMGAPRLGRAADFGIMAAVMLFLYPVSIVVHYLVLAFDQAREAERHALESRVAARESELRALRAQLNPHFLFNSLNSINALIGGDPEGARRMCESLGDFLRRTLNLGAREVVPLADELALVDRYLGIEHVRFGERLRVERRVDAAALRCLVPPLLLQPLVENAIKHGVANRLDGGMVRVEANRDRERLVIQVENDTDPGTVTRRGEGHGLDNVKRRLDAFSAREARLDVREEPGRFRVTLTLPAHEAAAAMEGTARA